MPAVARARHHIVDTGSALVANCDTAKLWSTKSVPVKLLSFATCTE